MHVTINKLSLMFDASNKLGTHRMKAVKAKGGWLEEDERQAMIKSVHRVVYILFNCNLDNDMAECTEEEFNIVKEYVDLWENQNEK
ncbi:MAG: hypothetical protein GY928_23255 [Colwellia sp.]|nr:hypothetical protein [Colwellia sp.]